MKRLILFARIILGLTFLVFGLNGFLLFIPVPEFHTLYGDHGFEWFHLCAEILGSTSGAAIFGQQVGFGGSCCVRAHCF